MESERARLANANGKSALEGEMSERSLRHRKEATKRSQIVRTFRSSKSTALTRSHFHFDANFRHSDALTVTFPFANFALPQRK
jgi:hypothetical protein